VTRLTHKPKWHGEDDVGCPCQSDWSLQPSLHLALRKVNPGKYAPIGRFLDAPNGVAVVYNAATAEVYDCFANLRPMSGKPNISLECSPLRARGVKTLAGRSELQAVQVSRLCGGLRERLFPIRFGLGG
jgi:hypothetical protein